jgi:hypothetical protein
MSCLPVFVLAEARSVIHVHLDWYVSTYTGHVEYRLPIANEKRQGDHATSETRRQH